MSGDRLEVNVTFDERGYIGSAPELRSSVVALSLGGLRRKVEMAQLSRIAQLDQRTALADQCLHSAEADVRPQGGSPGLIRTGHRPARAPTPPPRSPFHRQAGDAANRLRHGGRRLV